MRSIQSVGSRIARPLCDKASAIKAVDLGYDTLGCALGKRSPPRNSTHPFIARLSQFNIEMLTSKHALLICGNTTQPISNQIFPLEPHILLLERWFSSKASETPFSGRKVAVFVPILKPKIKEIGMPEI